MTLHYNQYHAYQGGGQIGKAAFSFGAPPASPVPPVVPVAPATPVRRQRKGRPLLILLLIALVIGIILGAVQLTGQAVKAAYQIRVSVGDQQATVIDLHQGTSIRPTLLGANVFPVAGSSSVDATNDGFMSYDAPIVNGLQSAHIKLLRFPGGNWGEQHTYSLDQLDAFSTLLNKTQADGIMQVQLTDPVNGAKDLPTRISHALLAVDYMNHQNSVLRAGKHAYAPFHHIALWTIGNEPDLLVNPQTGRTYTVQQYANDFIQFSLAMHRNDPSIKIYGPEISKFLGAGAGPKDARGQLWMDQFLHSMSDYERAHPELPFHILDGVSFHRYPLDDARSDPARLLNSASEWNATIPSLRQLIWQDFGRTLPIAVTEVNTNPTNDVPTRNLAAVWWANSLGALMNQQVDDVAFFSAQGVNHPYPLFGSHPTQETSMLRVMQLFSHLQHHDVPVLVQHQPVNIYATQDDAHKAVSLLLVNSSGDAQSIHINQNGLISSLPIQSWPQVNINLPAYSMIVVTLQQDGSVETDSFSNPTTDDAAAPAISHSVCKQPGSNQTAAQC